MKVKKYLKKVWRKNPEYIIIPATALPAAASMALGAPSNVIALFGGLPIAETAAIGTPIALNKLEKKLRKLKKVI